MENDSRIVYNTLQLVMDLDDYAEKHKRGPDAEARYWQGVCDTCRKVAAELRESHLFDSLFAEVARPRRDEP